MSQLLSVAIVFGIIQIALLLYFFGSQLPKGILEGAKIFGIILTIVSYFIIVGMMIQKIRNKNTSYADSSSESVEVGSEDTPISDQRLQNSIPDDIYPGQWVSPLSNIYVTQYGHGINNNAVDLRARTPQKIFAPKAGRVIEKGYVWNRHGNYLKILHKGGIVTGYCHLSEFYVNEGDVVEQGQVIGLTGNTGNTSGPHLHFSVDGVRNPLLDY